MFKKNFDFRKGFFIVAILLGIVAMLPAPPWVDLLTSPPAEVQDCISECVLPCGRLKISKDKFSRHYLLDKEIGLEHRKYCWNKCFVKCEEK